MQKFRAPVITEFAPNQQDIACYRGVELIYYGQMALTTEGDAILAAAGFGRAHYRAMYMIARNPGLNANALLTRLKITSQSLARVMGPLLDEGLVVQESDPTDRRQRQHWLSTAGAALEQQVLDAQFDALRRAYSIVGDEATQGFLRVLNQLMPAGEREMLSFPLEDDVS